MIVLASVRKSHELAAVTAFFRIHALAVMFSFCFATATAQTNASQNFETWPTTTSWGTFMQDGWVLSDGQVKHNRGGFGPPIDLHCGWLYDFDNSSNTWIMSPLLPFGADDVSFWVRRNVSSTGENSWEVQSSSDATNWTTAQAFNFMIDDWQQLDAGVDVLTPAYIRIIKTGDTDVDQYLGIDNIVISSSLGILLQNMTIDPITPSFGDNVHIEAQLIEGPAGSNTMIRAFYRAGDSGPFTELAMSNIGGVDYRTINPIPRTIHGLIQYYVEAEYQGIGPSPIFLPEGGSNSPAFYETDNPFLTSDLRQLNPSSHRTPLIISEIMFNPPGNDGTNSLEFIEIFNTEPVEKRIDGYHLSGDIDYTFPPDEIIGPRSYLVIARNPAALSSASSVGVALGPYEGDLPNNRGIVQLRNRSDALLLEVNYDTRMPWPIAADGAGHSLFLAKPDHGENSAEAWNSSYIKGGTPGLHDAETNNPLDSILINEFLAHTDLPLVDYIELFNYSTQSVDISGCLLSDSPATNKYTVPGGTVLAPGEFVVFSQTNIGFSLSSHGEEIYFSNPDGSRVIDAVRFGAQERSVSVGRFPDGNPRLHALAVLTPGIPNANAGLKTEDIVVNEIMYHPISGDDNDEYIELHNIGSNTVSVGDWEFIDGITYTVPGGTEIPAGGYLVIAKDAQSLINLHPQLNAGNTLGNFAGRLSDRGENVVLARPDNPLLPGQDLVVVDEVTYRDSDTWGHWSDGGGSSLELVDPRSDNRLAMNWAGSDETGKAQWTKVDATCTIDGAIGIPSELRMMHLRAGECLVDNITIMAPDASMTHFDDDFESGIASWSLLGNHSRSELSNAGGIGGSQALHLRASGAGNHHAVSEAETKLNHLARNLAGSLPVDEPVRIQAKVRWLAGWPHMLFVTRGSYIEAQATMTIPKNLGSPGLENSSYLPNTGPAISEAGHWPILPAPNQPTVVSAHVHDPDGVAIVTLKSRIDPSTSLANVPMLDDGTGGDAIAGDGIYSATVSAGNTSRLAFTIEATDAAATGETSHFPAAPLPGAPPRECVIRFGQDTKPGTLASYILWMTQDTINRWTSIPGGKYSDEPHDLTFVFGPYRAIYNAGGRWRGNWRFFMSPDDSGAYSIDLPERFMGSNEVKIDQPGQNGTDKTRLNEKYCYWLASEIDVPAPHLRFVHLYSNNKYRGTHHDLQTPSTDFCESWFDDIDPQVFKAFQWGIGDLCGIYNDGLGRPLQGRHRSHWSKRRSEIPNDDFKNVFKIAENVAPFPALDLYRKRIESVVDIRGWASFFTLSAALHSTDHYGMGDGSRANVYAYTPSHKPAWLFLYDMDQGFDGVVNIFPQVTSPIPNRLFNDFDPFTRVNYALAKELVAGPMTVERSDWFLDTWYSALTNNEAGDNRGVAIIDPSQQKDFVASAVPQIQALLAPKNSAFAITSHNFALANHIARLFGVTPVEVSAIRVDGILNDVRFTGINTWELDVGLPQGAHVLNVEGLDWRGNVVASDTVNLTITQPPPSPIDQLVITEIMYYPEEEEGEYVEVFNSSGSYFDMRGWRLDGASITFNGGAIIGPGEHKVIVENRTAYQYAYGNVELALGDYDGDLDNEGESIRLQMPLGSNTWFTIDEVIYDDQVPWPFGANGQGQALQVLDVSVDNNRPGNWGVSAPPGTNLWSYQTVSGVVSNLAPGTLASATFEIQAIGEGSVLVDDIKLVTGFVPEIGSNLIQNGDLETALSGPWVASGNHALSEINTNTVQQGAGSLELSVFGPSVLETNSVNQPLSLQGMGNQMLTLSFWHTLTNCIDELVLRLDHSEVEISVDVEPPPVDTGEFTSPGATNPLAQSLFPFPLLWINEVMPSNISVIADNMGEFEPWIELYNADSDAIDLSEYRLSNDYEGLGRWAFPTGTTIAAGSRMLVWVDGDAGQTEAGFLHTDFQMNAVSGSIILARQWLGSQVLIDYVDYDAVGSDASFGSFPEGEPYSRVIFQVPTPASANSFTSAPASVVINEWMSDNVIFISDPSDGHYDDWFELYNPTAVDADLNGYYLTDNPSVTNKFTLPAGAIVPAGGFLLVWADNEPGQNAPGINPHVNFGLNRNGDSIALHAPSGTLVDSVMFGPQGENQSYGCWPDGASPFYELSPPTPVNSNSVYVGFMIDVSTMSTDVYQVEVNNSLLETNWSLLHLVTAANGVVTFTDTNAASIPSRFYRLTED
jgi:hypothetical protein